MADSDNSRTLSTVTLGDFHSFVAASLPTHQSLLGQNGSPGNVQRRSRASGLATMVQSLAAFERIEFAPAAARKSALFGCFAATA